MTPKSTRRPSPMLRKLSLTVSMKLRFSVSLALLSRAFSFCCWSLLAVRLVTVRLGLSFLEPLPEPPFPCLRARCCSAVAAAAARTCSRRVLPCVFLGSSGMCSSSVGVLEQARIVARRHPPPARRWRLSHKLPYSLHGASQGCEQKGRGSPTATPPRELAMCAG